MTPKLSDWSCGKPGCDVRVASQSEAVEHVQAGIDAGDNSHVMHFDTPKVNGPILNLLGSGYSGEH